MSLESCDSEDLEERYAGFILTSQPISLCLGTTTLRHLVALAIIWGPLQGPIGTRIADCGTGMHVCQPLHRPDKTRRRRQCHPNYSAKYSVALIGFNLAKEAEERLKQGSSGAREVRLSVSRRIEAFARRVMSSHFAYRCNDCTLGSKYIVECLQEACPGMARIVLYAT